MRSCSLKARKILPVIFLLLTGNVATPTIAALKDYGDYQSWDRDRDGYLRTYEFTSQIYQLADQDGDGLLDPAEWARYAESWYDPFQAQQQYFSAYDSNKDGYLQESEFSSSVADSGIFATWDYDRNGYLDRNEWDKGITPHQRRAARQDKEEQIVITGDE